MTQKYPRTYHLPFSPGLCNDDRVMKSLNGFTGHEVVVTEKLDGENTSLYRDHFHARSLDSRHHPSRDWVKAIWGGINYRIPKDWRICGENMYATHSIHYENLKSYFYGFSVWDDKNVALDWDETVMFLDDLSIVPVPVLYRGPFVLKVLVELAISLDIKQHEGFVVRVADEIQFDRFQELTGKWVRPGHVQTSEHWLKQPMIPNKLVS